MAYEDFCRCTFGEFEAISGAWSSRAEALQRTEWERARLLAAISIQPHITKKITPQQLIPLPWDNEKVSEAQPRAELTPEQKRQRFAELAQRVG